MLSSLFGLGLIFLINVKANFQGYLHSLVHKKEATIHYQQQHRSVWSCRWISFLWRHKEMCHIPVFPTLQFKLMVHLSTQIGYIRYHISNICFLIANFGAPPFRPLKKFDISYHLTNNFAWSKYFTLLNLSALSADQNEVVKV